MAFPHRIEYRSHRISWTILRGPIPDGVYALHKTTCHNRKCVNPEHLYLGDQFDNMGDALEQGTFAHQKGETNANATITDEIALDIKVNYGGYGSGPMLAKKHNISQAMVRDVANRGWKHLDALAAKMRKEKGE